MEHLNQNLHFLQFKVSWIQRHLQLLIASYRSIGGMECSNFKTLADLIPCTYLGNLGMHKLDVMTIVDNCPKTCGYYQINVPSLAPSTNPTKTSSPTRSFSNAPVPSPSSFPSSPPSKLQSKAPNKIPSVMPSDVTSLWPSNSLSLSQSLIPTYQPSASSTYFPSTLPSLIPTITTSHMPSNNSLALPSYLPSTGPTLIPTKRLSENPTLSPSIRPSHFHTEYPSLVPTSTCHDTKNFRNRIGMACVDNAALDIPCESYYKIGFSGEEVYQLLVNCPRTCGICESLARPTLLEFVSKMQASKYFKSMGDFSQAPKSSSISYLNINWLSLVSMEYPIKHHTVIPQFIPTKNWLIQSMLPSNIPRSQLSTYPTYVLPIINPMLSTITSTMLSRTQVVQYLSYQQSCLYQCHLYPYQQVLFLPPIIVSCNEQFHQMGLYFSLFWNLLSYQLQCQVYFLHITLHHNMH